MGKDEEAKEINYTNKSKYLLYLADRCELIIEQMKLDKNEIGIKNSVKYIPLIVFK